MQLILHFENYVISSAIIFDIHCILIVGNLKNQLSSNIFIYYSLLYTITFTSVLTTYDMQTRSSQTEWKRIIIIKKIHKITFKPLSGFFFILYFRTSSPEIYILRKDWFIVFPKTTIFKKKNTNYLDKAQSNLEVVLLKKCCRNL